MYIIAEKSLFVEVCVRLCRFGGGKTGSRKDGKMGSREDGKKGRREDGKTGSREDGKMGRWEDGKTEVRGRKSERREGRVVEYGLRVV